MNFNPFHIFAGLPGFLKSTDFAKACILAVAITFPIVVGVNLEKFEIGLAMALGALLSSPSDVSGSLRHKYYGIILSAILAVLASLIGGYLIADSWLALPVLGLVVFSISYLAVFGFRASLIAFSGLFALVLSFANISTVLEIYERALLIGVGGLWYLSLTAIYQLLNPEGQTDQVLKATFDLMANYLKTRSRLIEEPDNREDLLHKLLDLQSEINDNHETLRGILISSRRTSGNSSYERRRLLIFIQLVDILELAMANPVDYEKLDAIKQNYNEQLEALKDLIVVMALRLDTISAYINKPEKIRKDKSLSFALNKVRETMANAEKSLQGATGEDYLILKNFYDYQEHQAENIKKIVKILLDADLRDGFIKKQEVARFITPQEYNPKLLLEHFSIRSSIFKHALRIAIVVVAGYSIGALFELQNSYWILLTIIVIMRPNYGLTKSRSKQRTIGTLIGAGIAIGIVLLTQNPVVYALLSIITLVIAFAMVQKNYKTSAVFVTLSVVFVYALLEPNVLNVIQFRVLDTLIGAGLATLGNMLLWPSWEFFGIKKVIGDSMKANRDYFLEVVRLYEEKQELPTSYKLSRKEAFLAIGNLNSAFQRMAQEPKSKQKDMDKIYQLTVLNHSFLASLASMGTYIQNHTTTRASGHFKTFTGSIQNKLERCLALITAEISKEVPVNIEQQIEAESFFEKKYRSMAEGINGDPEKSGNENDEELQELQLIYGQLKGLLDISHKLEATIIETKFL